MKSQPKTPIIIYIPPIVNIIFNIVFFFFFTYVELNEGKVPFASQELLGLLYHRGKLVLVGLQLISIIINASILTRSTTKPTKLFTLLAKLQRLSYLLLVHLGLVFIMFCKRANIYQTIALVQIVVIGVLTSHLLTRVIEYLLFERKQQSRFKTLGKTSLESIPMHLIR
jgi:hypothetical protein